MSLPLKSTILEVSGVKVLSHSACNTAWLLSGCNLLYPFYTHLISHNTHARQNNDLPHHLKGNYVLITTTCEYGQLVTRQTQLRLQMELMLLIG